MHVFVYGTLLKGMVRSNVMAETPYLGLGTIEGQIYDLGSFPGYVPGPGSVVGEIYEVDDKLLARLHGIEGYLPGHPDSSMYCPEPVEVSCFGNGRRIEALTYRYNFGLTSKDHPIASGDYRRSQLVKSGSSHKVYIAYGSNMSRERLEDRVGPVELATTGYLEGYALVFNKRNMNGSACANIDYRGAGYRCPFVGWKLDADQFSLLDACEGAPSTYRRIAIPYPVSSGGKQRLGYIYLACPDRIREGLRPTEEYLDHIRQGYAENGFPLLEVDQVASG